MPARHIIPKKKSWLMLSIAVSIVILLPFPFFKIVRADDDNPSLSRHNRFYSILTTKKFCRYAQKIIAQTKIKAINVVQSDFNSFANSFATPFESPDGDTLPLTTQQLVTYGTYPNTGRTYPQIISCKMKSADAIKFFYGEDAAVSGSSCRDIHKRILKKVFSKLKTRKIKKLAFEKDEVILEPDIVATNGPEWLNPFPPDLAYLGDDGLLHLQAKSLPVPRTVPPFVSIGPERKGVHYCHLAAPEYITALITGAVVP
ncbi:MAG: hypothetical protein QNJ49_18140 [Mastigocoleus sp. MO_167.B18]|nr:hypothetical protein [Mastigocoleus sp. MO_167.B18]